MQLIEVNNAQTEKEFLTLPLKIYRNIPQWVRPLDKEINRVFDPKKNPKFKNGECIRWILKDQNQETVGRVAAFVDYGISEREKQPTGGMGFFECVDNQEAANRLFEACIQWLQTKGQQAMDGPINFGDRNRWWGLLSEGFEAPNYGMNFNPPYYQTLFENYGFQDYFKQYTYGCEINKTPLNEVFRAKAERLKKNKSYEFKHIEKKNLLKYVEDFRTVYNKSWEKHQTVKQMTQEEAYEVMKEMKPIIDERLIWFAYYEGMPVGFMVMIPEINEMLRYVNGKMDFLGSLKFLYYRWRGECKTALGIVIGILPRFQGRGVESALIETFSHMAFSPKFPYRFLEFNWIGDFHPTMMHMYELLGLHIVKTHITFRKHFDESAVFERHPIIK